MSLLADVISAAAERIRTEFGVDAGLDEVAREVTAGDASAVGAARRLLAGRRQAVEHTQAAIRQLASTVAHLGRVLPFTEDGWPERRDALRERLATDLPAGLADWLEHWFAAAAGHRLDALRRLRTDVALPPGLEVLTDRMAAAEQAMAARSWPSLEPVLAAGAAGLQLAGRSVPGPATGRELRLLLVRLALDTARWDDAARLLDELDRIPDRDSCAAATAALRTRMARLRGDPDEAARLLVIAQDADPRDLDVTVELINKVRPRPGAGSTEFDTALDAARAAIDALPSLADLDSDLGRLIDPPAQLWVVAADRAARERDRAGALRLLDVADERTPAADDELLGTIDSTRAALLTDPAAVRAARLAAGIHRIDAGQTELAEVEYVAAMAIEPTGDPDDARALTEVHARWADSLIYLASRKPISEVQDQVRTAVELLRAARSTLTGPEWAWTHLAESGLLLQLGRIVGAEQQGQLWLAVQAAARGVVQRPRRAVSWTTFADAAQAVDASRTALVATARALAVDPSPDVTSEHIRALFNIADFDSALALLSGENDPWEQSLRGYALLYVGRPEDALRTFEGVLPMDPTWTWAWAGYLSALIQQGQPDRAIEESRSLAVTLADRDGEATAAWAAGYAALLAGDWARAAELADAHLTDSRGMSEDAHMLLGQALVLRGHQDGWDHLRRGLRLDPGPLTLASWDNVVWPVMAALADRYGLPAPDPAPVHDTLVALRDGLARRATPAGELRELRDTAGVPPEAADAVRLAELALAGTDPARPATDDRFPDADEADFPAEVDALREYLRERAEEEARSAEDERRRGELRAAVADGPSPARLRGLLAELPTQLDEVITAEYGDQVPDPIVAVLRDLLADPELGTAARNVLGWLGRSDDDVDDDDYDYAMLMPPSWFAGSADPVNDHPLFLRWLPEIRRRADRSLLSVRVRADEETEPDRILIRHDDRQIGQVEIDPDLRYLTGATHGLLPPVDGRPWPAVPTPFGPAVPATGLAGLPGYAELLSRGPLELAATAYADAVIAEQDSAPGPEPDPAGAGPDARAPRASPR